MQLPLDEFSYDDVSGKLIKFGNYFIIDPRTSNPRYYTIGNADATLVKVNDEYGRVTQTEAEIGR